MNVTELLEVLERSMSVTAYTIQPTASPKSAMSTNNILEMRGIL